MGVAADCTYVSNYGSPQNATKAILSDWNSATARYKVRSIIAVQFSPSVLITCQSTFNVSLGIVTLDVHDPRYVSRVVCYAADLRHSCPPTASADAKWNVACNSAITLNDRLSMFSEWRGAKGNDGIGLWHLMSGCPTGTEVGVAWLSTLYVRLACAFHASS